MGKATGGPADCTTPTEAKRVSACSSALSLSWILNAHESKLAAMREGLQCWTFLRDNGAPWTSLGAASGRSSLRCACLISCSCHGTFDKRASTVYHHGDGVCTSVSPTRSNVSLACALWPQMRTDNTTATHNLRAEWTPSLQTRCTVALQSAGSVSEVPIRWWTGQQAQHHRGHSRN